jgi:hypothetical protein
MGIYLLKAFKSDQICIQIYVFFFINVSVRASLRVHRLISWVLKLTTMQASSGPEICETRTGDL